jgi:hypothetical protein
MSARVVEATAGMSITGAEFRQFLKLQCEYPAYSPVDMKMLLGLFTSRADIVSSDPGDNIIDIIMKAKDALQDGIEIISNRVHDAAAASASKVEVRPTDTTMGDGLFVTEDVAVGDVMTAYPMHCARVDGLQYCFTRDGHRSQFDNAYSLEVGGTVVESITGDPSVRDPRFAGHFANDGVPAMKDAPFLKPIAKALAEGRLITEEDVAASMAWYIACDLRRNNAEYVQRNGFTAVVAFKPIARGEQVFVSYGSEYWVRRHYPGAAKLYTTLTDDCKANPVFVGTLVMLDTHAAYAKECVAFRDNHQDRFNFTHMHAARRAQVRSEAPLLIRTAMRVFHAENGIIF